MREVEDARLRMKTGLVGPALREVHRRIGIRGFGPYWHRAPELARAQNREERAARGENIPTIIIAFG